MESTNAIPTSAAALANARINGRKLFVLCCLCLATTSMSFALRTSIASDLKTELFDPINPLTSATMVGDVLSYAFLGFAFWVFLGSAVVDAIGMRNMTAMCGLSYIVGPLLVIGADRLASGPGAVTIVGIGMFINGFGWGCSETVINPLTTAIYPEDKVHRLNVLHAWWPFGMIVGGLLGYSASKIGLGWRVEFGLLLIPAVAILVLLMGTTFPKTERVAAGVTTTDMYKEALRPGFILWFLAMFLTSAAELAPGQWVDLSLSNTVGMRGILLQVYVAGLMFVMRHFAGTMVHKLSSVGLLFFSCLLASIGLFRAFERELARHGLPHGDDLGHGRLLHVADDARLRVGALPEGRRLPDGPRRLGGIAVDLFRAAADGEDLRQREDQGRGQPRGLQGPHGLSADGHRQRGRRAVVPRRRDPAGHPARGLRGHLAA